MSTLPPPPPGSSPQLPATGGQKPATGEQQKWWRRRWWKLPVWAWIVAAVVVLGAVGSAIGSDEDAGKSGATTPDETVETTESESTPPATDGPTTTAPATTTTVETTTTTEPATTSTQAPTTTAQPTTTLAPTTTLPPAPVVLEGTGDGVVDLPNTGPVIAQIAHAGGGNFAVWTLDSSLAQLDLLVNEIGNYNGRRPINWVDDVTKLEISASGNWSITLIPLTTDAAQPIDGGLTGSGPDVIRFDESGVYTLTHDGEANFAVWAYTSDGRDLVVNEIGAYSGSVIFRDGPGYIEIEADGKWSFAPA